MKKKQRYKGFVVRDVVPLEDCHGTGIHLLHERTGLEVFHILNNDEENMFAFTFRTPAADKTGAAHVLEHSVLCGSEHYPLKDPFMLLANQSVNTYLNAWTAPDRTIFPASSIVKADYFNVMAVYGDAVFFPLLRPEIFMQEAHRLELDQKGKASIQGVVYNEMKGVYTTFNSVAQDAIDAAILSGSCYEHDSGGDPLHIPDLTLEKLKEFHRTYYCPANCLVFLYGNIPTEEQLAFLDSHVLCHIKNGGNRAEIPPMDEREIPRFVKASGPADEANDSSKSTVALIWKLGTSAEHLPRSILESLFVGELLWGDDCAPVSKALLESGLGEDIAPQTGEDTQILCRSMCCGLRGVAPKDARKVEKVIMDTLERLCKDGVSSEDLERACMSFDFSNREIVRLHGPFSLTLLRRCLRGWMYGTKPWETLLIRAEFDSMKTEMAKNPNYVQGLLRRMLFYNEQRSLVMVTPSASWNKKRDAAEKKTAARLLAARGKASVRTDMQRLREFQNTEPTPEENRMIPRITVHELSGAVEPITTRRSQFKGIPLFTNTEPTNGIVYVNVAFPADLLKPEDYPLLPTVASLSSQMGWHSIPWDKTLSDIERTTGGFGAYVRSSNVPDMVRQKTAELKPWVGRDWVVFHFKVLSEKTNEAFELLSDCLTGTDFSDLRRLKELIVSQRNGDVSALLPSAHLFASLRACRSINHSFTVNEIWEGISAVFTDVALSKMASATLSKRLADIFARLKKGGAILHITSDTKGLFKARACLASFIKKAGIVPLKPQPRIREADFQKLTELGGASQSETLPLYDEVFTIPGSLGFAATTSQSAPFDTKECIADEVFAHMLETKTLWRTIRMEGGAYGVVLSPNSDSNVTRFATYRDPRPFDSLERYSECLLAACDSEYSAEEVEKAVTGCYAAEMSPRTPAGAGATGFLWTLYGLSNAQKRRRVKWLLSITPEDIRAAARRFARTVSQGKTVVICGKTLISAKNKERTGTILKLPL